MSETRKSCDVPFARRRSRFRLLGLTVDDLLRLFFGGSAVVSVVVLGLIALFLFKEGHAFFGDNQRNLETYRRAGLEYVDHVRALEQDHTALVRYLTDVRIRQWRELTGEHGMAPAAANAALESFDAFAAACGDAAEDLRDFVADLVDQASATKTEFLVNEDKRMQRRQLLAEGLAAEAERVRIEPVDFAVAAEILTGTLPHFREVVAALEDALRKALSTAPPAVAPGQQARLDRFAELVEDYIAGFPVVDQRLERWDPNAPVGFGEAVTAFVFGREWLTASFWQDWYGIVPLFTGSLLVAFIAMVVAVPTGVCSAVYVARIARPTEQRLIRPCIEFISAIPTVVLGFFGIAVLGQTLRALSQFEALAWIPGFPFSERLNALTAGCLLALVAAPTILTLAEDAIENVPRALEEASLALGATRLQTLVRIVVPASLPGLVSAVLLGFGRVIGETMVVLLCAGNRIQIPDITRGLAVATEPVHTMTGIVAQEMGEVVRGSIHYRALFCVGIVLFLLSLLVNHLAQKFMRRPASLGS